MKIHLPEKLTCFVMSPNGVWAAGGNASGHVYLWEVSECWRRNELQLIALQVASGLLLASFTPHYRSISTLTFTSDSLVLLTGSLDATVQVFMVSQLVDNASASGSSMTNFGGGGSSGGALGQRPYGTLGDHTLAIRAVVVGKTASIRGGRCLTASDDGTVKVR
jgi:pre-rRNA-processing protein IPI3